jgi:hypothetical protein
MAPCRDDYRGFFEQCFAQLLKHIFGYDGSSWLDQAAQVCCTLPRVTCSWRSLTASEFIWHDDASLTLIGNPIGPFVASVEARLLIWKSDIVLQGAWCESINALRQCLY